MKVPLILASISKPRRDLLYRAGISPTIRPSQVDEQAALGKFAAAEGITLNQLSTEQRVLILSQAKARAVAQVNETVRQTAAQAQGESIVFKPLEKPSVSESKPLKQLLKDEIVAEKTATGPFILGCDSMFQMDGVTYGKPHDADTARERLRLMSGNHGVLWTGHTLIDLASGQEEHAVSSAEINFATLTEEEIERYLETKEPLEVAGSFTLERFGGAFIESIVGDPHGVIGLSLPLLRTLFQRFNVSWPDLWNVKAHEQAAPQPQKSKPPVENIHQPGDGWIDCLCGHRHWGLNGAAGVLLARRNPNTGEVTDVVLQHRALWSAEGGTWGTPGGAIADGETALEGALRESNEEANFHPDDIEVVGTYKEDHGPWSYTTVLAFEKPGHTVTPRANDDESIGVEWVAFSKVGDYKLMPAFGADWPQFEQRLQEISVEMLKKTGK